MLLTIVSHEHLMPMIDSFRYTKKILPKTTITTPRIQYKNVPRLFTETIDKN